MQELGTVQDTQEQRELRRSMESHSIYSTICENIFLLVSLLFSFHPVSEDSKAYIFAYIYIVEAKNTYNDWG